MKDNEFGANTIDGGTDALVDSPGGDDKAAHDLAIGVDGYAANGAAPLADYTNVACIGQGSRASGSNQVNLGDESGRELVRKQMKAFLKLDGEQADTSKLDQNYRPQS